MAFFVILAIAILAILGYVKMFGKPPCGCHDKEIAK